MEKIEILLDSFNPTLKGKFGDIVTDQNRDALNSIVANRNNIAHGRNVGVSYVRVKDWYQETKKIMENIRSVLSI